VAVASLLLAALWGMSVFDGWSRQAFCPGAEPSPDCAARIAWVAVASGVVALFAAFATVAALLTRRENLLAVAVAAWAAAVGVLFVGGVAVR
jgi:hypothetical protein